METGAVYSQRVLTPAGIRPASVRFRDGRIQAIVDRPLSDAEDLGDALLMPSLADTHVHINEPGRTEWEGFETATRAAALGGITLLADMPLNSDPVTTTLDALQQKIAAAAGKLSVDCALWGGVVPSNADQLVPMMAAGVHGFKCFLVHSGIDEFPEVTEADLLRAMPILAASGVPLLVHAELEQPIREAPSTSDPRAYIRYLHSRPREWEDAAIAMMIALARQTGCRVHIVHLSSATALPMLRAARREGLPVTVETCPHYLCLTSEEIEDGATSFKCAPPIRERSNREALWAGLAEGVIDFVVSDHSPCIPSLKLPESGDFMSAWGGIASLQLGLASVWSEAQRRGHTLETVSRWMSAGPLDFLGLGGERGAIAVGHRADLVAWQPEADFTVTADRLAQRHPITPYLGRTVHGMVTDTWLCGRRIVRAGKICAPPSGRLVLRSQSDG